MDCYKDSYIFPFFIYLRDTLYISAYVYGYVYICHITYIYSIYLYVWASGLSSSAQLHRVS
jgi:hypothetical protein